MAPNTNLPPWAIRIANTHQGRKGKTRASDQGNGKAKRGWQSGTENFTEADVWALLDAIAKAGKLWLMSTISMHMKMAMFCKLTRLLSTNSNRYAYPFTSDINLLVNPVDQEGKADGGWPMPP